MCHFFLNCFDKYYIKRTITLYLVETILSPRNTSPVDKKMIICIGLDKQKFLSIQLLIFSYTSLLTYVLGAQKNPLIETVLLSTHNICFGSFFDTNS